MSVPQFIFLPAAHLWPANILQVTFEYQQAGECDTESMSTTALAFLAQGQKNPQWRVPLIQKMEEQKTPPLGRNEEGWSLPTSHLASSQSGQERLPYLGVQQKLASSDIPSPNMILHYGFP